MKKAFVYVRAELAPYGLVRIGGMIETNPFYGTEDPQFEPPYFISDLSVIDADGEVLQGRVQVHDWRTHNKINVCVCGLDQIEAEKCEEYLIEKFLDEKAAYHDRLIDEAVESGRSMARYAYS